MNRRTKLAAIGGYQPFLFCIGMYFVALFFSIFICSAIFYAVNPKPVIAKQEKSLRSNQSMASAGKQLLITVAK